jgi:hypothetical protein
LLDNSLSASLRSERQKINRYFGARQTQAYSTSSIEL